jgi:hypothetical protein
MKYDDVLHEVKNLACIKKAIMKHESGKKRKFSRRTIDSLKTNYIFKHSHLIDTLVEMANPRNLHKTVICHEDDNYEEVK